MLKLKKSARVLVFRFLDNIAASEIALYPLVHHIKRELGGWSLWYLVLNTFTAKHVFRCYFGMFLDGFTKITEHGWLAAPEVLGGEAASLEFRDMVVERYSMSQLNRMKEDLKRVINDPAPYIPDEAR